MASQKKPGKGKHEAKGPAPKAPPPKAAVPSKPGADDQMKRKVGLLGGSPWAGRNAAKGAAEARARAAERPLPGSVRATIRTPAGAEDIKARIADLHNALSQIKGLRKNLLKTFFDI